MADDPVVTPVAGNELVRLTAWLNEQPDFGDMRMINPKDGVRVGDVRKAVKLANELTVLREMVRGAVDRNDAVRSVASVLVDALGDRDMLNALERVGGVLRAETMPDGSLHWTFKHHVEAVTDHDDVNLRNVLAANRRDNDNAAVLRHVLQDQMTSDSASE